jgi:hypothetical protein
MSIKISATLHAVLSRQDLASDDVTYELEMSLLGVPVRIACPDTLVGRIDELLRGEAPQRTQPQQSSRTKAPEALNGYDVGVLEDYDVDGHV